LGRIRNGKEIENTIRIGLVAVLIMAQKERIDRIPFFESSMSGTVSRMERVLFWMMGFIS